MVPLKKFPAGNSQYAASLAWTQPGLDAGVGKTVGVASPGVLVTAADVGAPVVVALLEWLVNIQQVARLEGDARGC